MKTPPARIVVKVLRGRLPKVITDPSAVPAPSRSATSSTTSGADGFDSQ